GVVISPLLSNIYLHYVLDAWFSEEIQPRLKGRSFIVRYADDFVLGFEEAGDVSRVMRVLPKRFKKFNLELHPTKTQIINLDNNRGEGQRSFDFLGFTHYCLFRLKSIPVFQFKSIPLLVNKKGLEEGIWPMGQIPSSNRRFFRRSPFFRSHNIPLFFVSHLTGLPQPI